MFTYTCIFRFTFIFTNTCTYTSGEERFRVALKDNDDVVFSILSYTKGSGLLGK